MKKRFITSLLPALTAIVAMAQMDGSLDPPSVVEAWSTDVTAAKIIDVNFNDTFWPDTWGDSGTGIQCPEYSTGRYVNAIINVPTGTADVAYPIMFHNCIFANRNSNGGTAGATAAFSRQYYESQKATNYNDWQSPGHTTYLEENIEYNAKGVPVHGEAGFVQMCRNAADGGESLHGWMEIDHIPYVERIQWSWSSTSWGRGIKLDIKIGDGEWKPLVWMGSEKQKQGWTLFSDQGYFMENVIDAKDVSLRWRVWDGDGAMDSPEQVQTAPFDWQAIDPLAQRQAPRVHKLKIYGDPVTAEQAQYAIDNPVGNPGELSDLSQFGSGGSDEPAPDDDADVTIYYVDPAGGGDYTTIQEAIDAVPDGNRGIIFIAPGVYDENLYAGTRDKHDKFISLIGADASTTILTSSVNRGGESTTNTYLDCAALNVFTQRFYAENLTIRNTSGNVGQAEALYTAADAHLFRDCVIEGFQDTYKANSGARGYFTGCTISGATDFIYDGGLEWFENCDIICLAGGHYITAPAESSMPMNKVLYPVLSEDKFYPGLFFNKCRVKAGEGVKAGDYYLGRPWKETGGAMFLNSTLGSHINAAGWAAWNGNESTASFYEYRNIDETGAAVVTTSRAAFSHQATEAEVEAYMNAEFLFGKFSKVPFDYETILKGVDAPNNFTLIADGFAWDNNPQAVGYAIYRDGEFEAIVTESVYQPADYDASATYTVKAISRHGVTTAAVRVADAEQTPAFPTAQGFGRYATGGRGGKVVKVTSLADDGSAGTLRWAFEQYKGEPITILFDVTGDIALSSELRVNRSDWTLAGQSAPGEGIVITRNKVNFGGSQNFIVRNVRFRSGQRDAAGNVLTDNACGAENCSNYIFDHCSFGWSVEENMNTADSHFLTVQNSIVHEGLYRAGHSKGDRGYGCQWGGSPATYHHNLLAHNNSRSCRFNGARGEDYVVFIEYANNVNYNYGKNNCYGGENTADVNEYNGLNSAHECNFMGNYYKPGPISSKTDLKFVTSSYAREGAKSWGPAKWFVNGNIADGFPEITADNWKGMSAETYKLDDIRVNERITPALAYYKYTATGTIGNYVPARYMLEDMETAEDAYKTVLATVGTVNRDKVEKRIVEDVTSGKATYGGAALGNGIIDTEKDAEGFFDYAAATAAVDTDGDGMPDEWEKANGLNPAVADNNLVNSEGYTALEVYLNSIMGELCATDFGSGVQAVLTSANAAYDPMARVIRVSEESIGGVVEFYTTDGRLVRAGRIDSTMIGVDGLAGGTILVRISSKMTRPAVLKIVL